MTQVQEIRTRLGLTQTDMAGVLGLGLRAYQEIEAGRSKERMSYVRAAQHYALEWGVVAGDPTVIDAATIALARRLVAMLDGRPAEPI